MTIWRRRYAGRSATAGFDAYVGRGAGRDRAGYAVEQGFRLNGHALDASRDVLRGYGNMSSATLMLMLKDLLASDRRAENGFVITFGPGLAAEGFRFRRIARRDVAASGE